MERRCWLKLSKHLPGGNFTDDISFFFVLQSILRYFIQFYSTNLSSQGTDELRATCYQYSIFDIQLALFKWEWLHAETDLFLFVICISRVSKVKGKICTHTWALSSRKLESCTNISGNLIKTLFLELVNSDPTVLVLILWYFSFTDLI